MALILRVYSLWDNRKIAKRLLIGGFVACYSLTTAFVVLFVIQANRGNSFHLSMPHSWRLTVAPDGITYSAAIDSCVLGNSTYLTVVLGGMALFDLHVIALLVVSTLGRPRRNDAEIVNNLKRDGFLAFLAVLGVYQILCHTVRKKL